MQKEIDNSSSSSGNNTGGGGGTFMYFAYGSNLLKERIHINNPTAQVDSVGKLFGWRLTFDVPIDYTPSLWWGASATIRPAGPDDYVYGLIWRIKTEHMAYLDSQETFYTPFQVDVLGEKGELINCRTYEMHTHCQGVTLPSPHYKEVIVTGAKQNGLPADYIRFLENIPDNGLKDSPPNYLKVMEMVKHSLEEKEKKEKESRGQTQGIMPLVDNISVSA